MFTYTEIPSDLFERNLSAEELYIEIYKYKVKSSGEKGFKVDGTWISVESINLEKRNENFFVPSVIFGLDDSKAIRGIDVIIYTYLAKVASLIKSGTVKFEISDLYNKTKIRKTQIKTSLNNLARMGIIKPDKKSGYYLIEELDLFFTNPEQVMEIERMANSILKD
ncbi:hypothetical protein [Metabacillus malikii]|uniref:Uncharacterized protein n=1 Tax=Metabacillus malikii TaxID=1504265 RepID=A0ABT9ZK86_9BACI|nr:hypothetical protein [Metabacillus malikii]MDQ0232706.1 hypothetical protein [Metabacillus malikii]